MCENGSAYNKTCASSSWPMPRLGNIFDVDGPMSKGCFSDLPVEGMEVSSGPKLCISSADHVFCML